MTSFPLSEIQGANVPIKHWANAYDIESSAIDQLRNVAALPVVCHHVAVMPDVHYGKGATVGSVIAMKDAVSAACVGVDIGCGMSAAQTSLTAKDLPESLKDIRHQIERDIPVGFYSHKDLSFLKRHDFQIKNEYKHLFSSFKTLHSKVQNRLEKAQQQIGTLGGGNHFVELCLDEKDNVWIMLHSGSRNIGKELAEIHINVAKELTHNQSLPDKDLAYFLAQTPQMDAYRRDLYWAQKYAKLNRTCMFLAFQNALLRFFPEMTVGDRIDCHHNYVSEEIHFGEKMFITRKGAIYAGYGAMGICPGSMGTRSYIVRGKGNSDSYSSAAHGAGRRMSRGQAKRNFTLDDLEMQTKGVECRKDQGVLDEIPGAYKDIDQVMESQSNLVETVAVLKQILCVKG